MIASLALALVCVFAAGVCWYGVRRSSLGVAFLAGICMLVLGGAALDLLETTRAALEAYARGNTAVDIPVSGFWLAALAFASYFTPKWLRGDA